METKRCTKCGEEKGLDQFYVKSGRRESHCSACCREKAREYRSRDLNASREAQKRYRLDNSEKIKANQAKHYKKKMSSPEARKNKRASDNARFASLSREDRDAINLRRRERYAANIEHNRLYYREKSRKHYRKNPEKFIAIAAKQRAERSKIEGNFTGKDLQQSFIVQKGRCFYCGIKIDKSTRWHADHFIPISRGGSNYPANIVIACSSCNLFKGNKMPWEWMPQRFEAPIK